MSFGSSLDTKEQVKQAVDIVDLVGGYIQLRRDGRGYKGLCPWHDDTSPSLQVNPERQSFKCWVCDIGGDVFSFVMKMESVEFREALTMLADRAGVELRPSRSHGAASGGKTSSSPFSGDDKRALFRAMAWAEQQYHDCLLNSPDAEPARRYLEERSVSAENIKKFHLGYSPNQWDWLMSRVDGKESRLAVLETIGLLAKPPDGGRRYDRFRGRVLFSIRDPQDRPVGMGGRVLPESGSKSSAKYINSPETPLFSKSNLLYGLDVARQAMRKSGVALVMEGYTDCMAAHQYGFENAVAVLGTALGPRHVRILKRFAERIVLILDGDEAGQRRTNEVLELFVAQNVDLRILTLPEGSDPCDFLQEHGEEAFRDLLESRALDCLEHAFQAATRGVDVVDDIHAATRALEGMLAILAKAPRLSAGTSSEDRLREQKMLERLAFKFRVPEQDVRDRLKALRRDGARRRSAAEHFQAGQTKQASQTGPPGGPNVPDVRADDELEIPDDIFSGVSRADQGDSAAGEFPVASGPIETGPIVGAERELLEILVRHPQCVGRAREEIEPSSLASVLCQRVYAMCCRLVEAGVTPSFDRLMLEFDHPAVKSLLVELDEQGAAKGVRDPEAILEELIESFRRHKVIKRRPADSGALRGGELDDDEQLSLLQRIQRQERARQGISDPTEG